MSDFWNRHRDTDCIEVTVRRVEGSALRVRETFSTDLKSARAALARPAGDVEVGERPNRVMTREEYDRLSLKGWHKVCRDYDSAGNVAVIYLDQSSIPEAKS